LEKSLAWALAAGILLDMHSFYFYGLNTISLFTALIIANLALTKFFTNRSVYSYILLTIISLALFDFIKMGLVFLLNFFTKNIFYQEVFSLNYLASLGYKLLFGTVIIFGSFYFMNYYSRKMKSFFLMPKNEKNIHKKI
jgi:cell shape-determining protein MreD